MPAFAGMTGRQWLGVSMQARQNNLQRCKVLTAFTKRTPAIAQLRLRSRCEAANLPQGNHSAPEQGGLCAGPRGLRRCFLCESAKDTTAFDRY
jgi:hypothetical protein